MNTLQTLTLFAAGWYAAAAARSETDRFSEPIPFPQALMAPLLYLLLQEGAEHEAFEPREKWMRAARGVSYKMEMLAREIGLSLPRGDWLICPVRDAAYIHWGVE